MLRRASTCVSSINALRASLAGYKGVLDDIERVFDDEDKYIEVEGKKDFKSLNSGIYLKNVSFSYPARFHVLRNINMEFKKGTTTAIVGHTGAGKTTIIHLLVRFYDVGSGQVCFDDIDIKNFTFHSLRMNVALVSQATLAAMAYTR